MRQLLRRFVEWMSAQTIDDVSALTIDSINRYQLHLNDKRSERGRNERLTKRSIQTYMRHVKVFVTYCHAKKFIAGDPAKEMIKPKAEHPIIEILTDAEIDAVLSCFGATEIGLRNTALIALLLDCGLRLGEVTRLEKDDINFDQGYIKVMGKGRKGRIVPLGVKIRELLSDYQSKRRPAKLAEDDKYFFLTIWRGPITAETVSDLMRRLKDKTGIKRMHAHLLRHTFATNYLIYGLGDVYELSRLMGHSDIKITEKYVQLASYYTIMRRRDRQTYFDTVRNKNKDKGFP